MPENQNPEGKTATAHEAAKKKILIVDDHPMMREGLRGIINHEPDLLVCYEAENATKAMAIIEKKAPDLALVDITMPGKSGLELVKDIRAMRPKQLILAISMHDESLYAERLLRAGARGYINKHQPGEELLKAIRRVLDGEIYLSREISENLLQRFSGGARKMRSPMEILTDREFEIFQMIGEGKSSKDIAQLLHLSQKTIAVHNGNIRHKLKIKTTGQLIRYAIQLESAER